MLNCDIIIYDNIVDISDAKHYIVSDICKLLTEIYSGFPKTGRIYYETISLEGDVTPIDILGINKLAKLNGKFFIVIYPAEPISATAWWIIGILTTITVIGVGVAIYLHNLNFNIPALRSTSDFESPNNSLSRRENTPRINQRIPDIFGTVVSIPDLLTVPYTIYENNRQVEYVLMSIGRGEYDIPLLGIKDGATRIADIAGISVEVYGPSTSLNSEDLPYIRLGTPINENIYQVQRITGVKGQVLLPNSLQSYTFNTSNEHQVHYPDEIRLISSSDKDFTDYFVPGDEIEVVGCTLSGTLTGNGVSFSNISVIFKYPNIIKSISNDFSNFKIGDVLTLNVSSFIVGTTTIDLSYNGPEELYIISNSTTNQIELQFPSNINDNWNKLATSSSNQESESVPNVDLFTKSAGVLDPVSIQTTAHSSSDPHLEHHRYTILTVTSNKIILANPARYNAAWGYLARLIGQFSNLDGSAGAYFNGTGYRYVGPFIIEDMDHLYVNFIAPAGLYKDDGTDKIAVDIEIIVECAKIDINNQIVGSYEITTVVLKGTIHNTYQQAITAKITPTFSGRCQIRAYRQSATDTVFSGQVVDEVVWEDLYAVKNIPSTNFGDITTVYVRTHATGGASSIKKRKFNMLVTRKIPIRISNTNTFTTTKTVTNKASDIFAAICLDKYIGRQLIVNIDIDNIYSTISEVEAYFNTHKAAEFCYTFDKTDLSFEETINIIASAVFCTAFRQGGVIKFKFERAIEDCVLLFNHRNKLPGSETRVVTFGNLADKDGVEYQWVDPDDNDSIITLHLPRDKSASNPYIIESTGIRNYTQAFQHAYRIWNKLRYSYITTTFDATQEANLLALTDKVLITDGTRAIIQEGQIESYISPSAVLPDSYIYGTSSTLHLSQKVELITGTEYALFIQTVRGIFSTYGLKSKFHQGVDEYHIIIQSYELYDWLKEYLTNEYLVSVSNTHFTKATYKIVKVGEDPSINQFIIEEKEVKDGMTVGITASNYTPAYYGEEGLLLWYEFKNNDIDSSAFKNIITMGAGSSIQNEVLVTTIATGVLNTTPAVLSPRYSTVTAWINMPAISGTGLVYLICSKNNTTNIMAIDIATKKLLVRFTFAGEIYSTNSISTDTWVHVSYVVGLGSLGLTVYLYVNGVLDEQKSIFVSATPNEIHWGGPSTPDGGAFIGKANDIRVYGRSLATEEIYSLYTVTKNDPRYT